MATSDCLGYLMNKSTISKTFNPYLIPHCEDEFFSLCTSRVLIYIYKVVASTVKMFVRA
jgi:hypothetical protein